MPALFTSTDGVPRSASTRSRTSMSAPASVTSASSRRAQPAPGSAGCTSIPTTVAPAAARAAVQAGPRLPRAPATTATRPVRSNSPFISADARGDERRRLLGELEGLERERLVRGDRLQQPAADDRVERVRRKPPARRLQRDVVEAQDVARREVGRGDEL